MGDKHRHANTNDGAAPPPALSCLGWRIFLPFFRFLPDTNNVLPVTKQFGDAAAGNRGEESQKID